MFYNRADSKIADNTAKGRNMQNPSTNKFFPYLFHGSPTKLNIGDKLICHTNYNSDSTEKVKACFATSSLAKAKYFGCVNCVRAQNAGNRSQMDNNKIYLTYVAENVKKKFYVYLVDANEFALDAKNEYMSDHEVPIRGIIEFDLMDTLNQDKIEIFQVPPVDKNIPVAEQIEQFKGFINSGQAHHIDVAELIKNQTND
jgi:hypothetical protein